MNIENYIVANTANIRTAIKKLDKAGIGFLVIVNNSKQVVGVLTDGDFRRAILKEVKLDNPIERIFNKDFISIAEDYKTKEVINIFLQHKIDILPVVTKDSNLVNLLFREDFNLEDKHLLIKNKKITTVIMAGGKGTRMKPFTNILPKPLIPIGDKSILEVIMDEYNLFFDTSFQISVNHKAGLIKAYLEDVKHLYDFSYIEEDKPLGTGGALKFLEGKIDKPFFVSNCDIIIKANYQDIYDWHIDGNNDITIVASMIHYKVPYGVCEISNGGKLEGIVEKPEYDFLVNAGMYIINPTTLSHIPENEFYNITDLINKIKTTGGRVGVFPVSEKSYLDGGQWHEYRNMIDSLT